LAAVGLGWVFRLTALSTTTVSPGGSDLAWASVRECHPTRAALRGLYLTTE
jgi:hypothetical protein